MVGGGHNGLTNAAYLSKSGLRVLVLEQRHLVGGAAITEELVPGFHFTTFSYALSLLRPEIVQELDLVRHGFMPLMMPSGFHPTGDGGYLLLESQQDDALVSVVAWLVGGVLVHDVLVAAVALVVGFVVTRVVPRRARGPLVVGLVVLLPLLTAAVVAAATRSRLPMTTRIA